MKHTILAKRLKQLMQERNMTVAELARRAEVVDNTVRQLTLGNSEAPTFRVGLALARAFGIHPEELLFVPEEAPRASLVDRMDRLEAAVALQDSRQTTGTPAEAGSPLVERMEKLEAVVLKMLQAQGLHQKELEELRRVIRPAEATRRAGKRPAQAMSATRKA